jgi:hypothetical protein
MALAGVSHASEPTGLILYFDPDGNHEAIVQIATLFNDYLARNQADLSFQAVKDREKFEMLLGSPRARYTIVSSDYLRRQERALLKPILVPVRRNSWFYTKVLVDSGEGAAGDLTGHTIAAAHGGGRTSAEEILDSLRDQRVNVTGAEVTLVPSDVNAILAVVFKRADAALVTQESIDAVLGAYGEQRPKMRKIFETQPILRSPLCSVGPRSDRGNEEVIALLEGMKTDPIGRKVMAQLRIDGWVRYQPSMERTK